MTKKHRSFLPEFKLEAVALARKIGFRQAAEELDVIENNIRTWSKAVDERGNTAFAPVSERTDLEAENNRLREELRQMKMERDILKKATAFFAKESE